MLPRRGGGEFGVWKKRWGGSSTISCEAQGFIINFRNVRGARMTQCSMPRMFVPRSWCVSTRTESLHQLTESREVDPYISRRYLCNIHRLYGKDWARSVYIHQHRICSYTKKSRFKHSTVMNKPMKCFFLLQSAVNVHTHNLCHTPLP